MHFDEDIDGINGKGDLFFTLNQQPDHQVVRGPMRFCHDFPRRNTLHQFCDSKFKEAFRQFGELIARDSTVGQRFPSHFDEKLIQLEAQSFRLMASVEKLAVKIEYTGKLFQQLEVNVANKSSNPSTRTFHDQDLMPAQHAIVFDTVAQHDDGSMNAADHLIHNANQPRVSPAAPSPGSFYSSNKPTRKLRSVPPHRVYPGFQPIGPFKNNTSSLLATLQQETPKMDIANNESHLDDASTVGGSAVEELKADSCYTSSGENDQDNQGVGHDQTDNFIANNEEDEDDVLPDLVDDWDFCNNPDREDDRDATASQSSWWWSLLWGSAASPMSHERGH